MTSLPELLQSDSELASLPEIYQRVSELLENERADARQIGAVIESDPALTTRILKMVNSAYYGFSRQIASISQAITILGRERLRQILIGTVLGSRFALIDNRIFSLSDFWHHSVKCAILARHIARGSKLKELAENLFTAALLHEIGRLILAQKLPTQVQQVRQATEQEHEDILMAENRILGFTHCEVGAAFISLWGLPALLADAARYHHTPRQAGSNHEAVQLIYLANSPAFFDDVIQQDGISDVFEQIDDWQELGLDLDNVTDACIQADQQVFEVMDALGMGQLISNHI